MRLDGVAIDWKVDWKGLVGREGTAEFSSRCVEFEETAGAS